MDLAFVRSLRRSFHLPAVLVRLPAVLALALGAGLALAGVPAAQASDEVALSVAIKDHRFDPAEIRVPAGKSVKLTVTNLDDTAEEFESYELKFEKVIGGKQSAIVRLKPLDKGRYDFFGEYHEATAKGAVIAE